MLNKVTLRQATPANLPEMKELYRGTIMEVCSGEYNESQRQVWAASAEKTERWEAVIASQYVLLAMTDAGIAGFASLDKGNYIDFLYVHKISNEWVLPKPCSLPLRRRQPDAALPKLPPTSARLPGRFLKKKATRYSGEQVNPRGNVELINYKMKKVVGSPKSDVGS